MGLNFVFSAYAGMGAVFHWDKDPKGLVSSGIYETLTKERGLFAMDEYVLDTIGIHHESYEARNLGKLLSQDLCRIIDNYLDDYDLRNDYEGLLIGMKAMYLFGMIFEGNRLRIA